MRSKAARHLGYPGQSDKRLAALAAAALLLAGAAPHLIPEISSLPPSARALLHLLLGGGALLLLSLLGRATTLHGFLVDVRWRERLGLGASIGLLSLSGYLAAAAGVGAVAAATPNAVSAWLRVPVVLGEVLFVATVVQIFFCGFLLEILKRGSGPLLAVLVVAVSFGLLEQAGPEIQGGRLLGVFLVMALLSVLRLAQGSIYLGTGLLFGWMAVERMRGMLWSNLAAPAPDVPLASLFISSGTVKGAPLFWLAIGCALAGTLPSLYRKHEAEPTRPGPVAIPAALKQIYPLSHPSLLAPLDLWLARLGQAGWRIDGKYLPRLAFTLLISAVSTPLALPERLLLPVLLRKRKVPAPIFIVGVHRSGTTHLHNLLALDPNLVAPRLFQVLNPHGFVFSGWLLLPLLLGIPPRRPMDNMSLHFLSPAEEEYAVLNSSALSPYWGFTFPRQTEIYDRFIYSADWSNTERSNWEQCYLAFLRRLVLFTHRRPVLKSPYNTGRIELLRRLFPDARFIHIRRHPYRVYRSNSHLVEHGLALSQLQEPGPCSAYLQRFPDHYLQMERIWERERTTLGSGRAAEVRFEDLEQDPVGEIQRLYAQLGLELTAPFRARLEGYLQSLASYRKNRFETPPDSALEQIYRRLWPLYVSGGYDKAPPD